MPPANDNWVDAELLTIVEGTDQSLAVDITGATTETAEQAFYDANGYVEPYNSVWYKFVAPADAKIELRTTRDADVYGAPIISLFGDGASLGDVVDNLLAYDDVLFGRDRTSNRFGAIVVKEVAAGQTYYVRLSNYAAGDTTCIGSMHLHYRVDALINSSKPPASSPSPGTHDPRVYELGVAPDFTFPFATIGDAVNGNWLINFLELMTNVAVGSESVAFLQFEKADNTALGQVCFKKFSDDGTTATFGLVEKMSGNEWTQLVGLSGFPGDRISFTHATASAVDLFETQLYNSGLFLASGGAIKYTGFHGVFSTTSISGFSLVDHVRFGKFGAGGDFTILAGEATVTHTGGTIDYTDFGPDLSFHSDSIAMPANSDVVSPPLPIDYPSGKASFSITEVLNEFSGHVWPPVASSIGQYVMFADPDTGMTAAITPKGLTFAADAGAVTANGFQGFMYAPPGGPRDGVAFTTGADSRRLYVPEGMDLILGFISHGHEGNLDSSRSPKWNLTFSNQTFGTFEISATARYGMPIISAKIPLGRFGVGFATSDLLPIANDWPYFIKFTYDSTDHAGFYSSLYGRWQTLISADLGVTWTTLIDTDARFHASRLTEGYTILFQQKGGGESGGEAWDVTFLNLRPDAVHAASRY